MNVTLPKRLTKPRNPLVAAARMRRAGSHRAAGHSIRQGARRTLERELQALSRSA